MPNLQELDNDQINEAIQGAAEKRIPVALTCRKKDGWVIFHSRFVALQGQHILLAMPRDDDGEPRQFELADRVGLSFKYRHHKHICSATVAGLVDRPGEEDTQVLSVISPTKMHRLQRRVYQRVTVPESKIVRASFWSGGQDSEPIGSGADLSVWTGTVDNISAGGFQMVCHDYTGPELQLGDAIGVHLTFGLGRESCFADGQFRHFEQRDDLVILGFQFVGLAQSRQGRAALQMISSRVSEFQRIAEGRRPHRRTA